MRAMRIVLLNQFYPPDLAPTGHYLQDVARALVARGHDVTVIASAQGYAGDPAQQSAVQQHDGVRVRRLAGTGLGRTRFATKLVDYAAYYARVGARLAREERPDVVVALTTPPFLGLLARWMARARGCRHVHWVMDVYPDVLQAHGLLSGPPYALLQVVARHSLRDASAVIALGPAMLERVAQYCGGATQLQWVPLWSPEGLEPWPAQAAVPMRAERGWPAQAPVLLYSGNFGLGHRFEEFIAAAARLGADGPRWAFAGQGPARIDVEQRVARLAPGLPVELLPYAPAERLGEHLASADVHLVSLDARWEGLILPSKLQASFAVGRPVICVGSHAGDLGRWIRDSGAGWVVAPGDVDGMLRAVSEARTEHGARGEAAARFARVHFDRDTNTARVAALIEGR